MALPRDSTPPLSCPSRVGRNRLRVSNAKRAPRTAAATCAHRRPGSDDRGPEIVVGDARRHAIEMRKGPDVAIEKTDLILPLVDPREVAARGTSAASGTATLCGGCRRRRRAPRRSRLRPDRPADRSAARRPRDAAASIPRPPLSPRSRPTRCPSATNNACSRVAVSRCLPPVHRTESASTACTRSAIASHTGRGRGVASAFRAGAAWSTYFPTVVRERPSSRATARCVRPSTSTLCRTTCTRSILSILSANPRSLDPASPPSGPQVAYFPSGVWPTF